MNDKEQKKLIDRNGVREAIGKYDGTQKLSEDEIRIALRAIDWINASANNSQAKLSENSGVSSGRLSPFFAGKYVGDTHGVVEGSGARSVSASRPRARSRRSRSAKPACGSA